MTRVLEHNNFQDIIVKLKEEVNNNLNKSSNSLKNQKKITKGVEK